MPNAPTMSRPPSGERPTRPENRSNALKPKEQTFGEKVKTWYAQQLAKRLRTDRKEGKAHEGLVKLKTGETEGRKRGSKEWSRTVVRVDSWRVISGADRRFVRNNRAAVGAEVASIVKTKQAEAKNRPLTNSERRSANKEAIDIVRINQKSEKVTVKNRKEQDKLNAKILSGDIRRQTLRSQEYQQAVNQRIEDAIAESGKMPSQGQEAKMREQILEEMVQENADIYTSSEFALEVANQISNIQADRRAEQDRLNSDKLMQTVANSPRGKALNREASNLGLSITPVEMESDNTHQTQEGQAVRLDKVSIADLQEARRRAFKVLRARKTEQNAPVQNQNEHTQAEKVEIPEDEVIKSPYYQEIFNPLMIQAQTQEDITDAHAIALQRARDQMANDAKNIADTDRPEGEINQEAPDPNLLEIKRLEKKQATEGLSQEEEAKLDALKKSTPDAKKKTNESTGEKKGEPKTDYSKMTVEQITKKLEGMNPDERKKVVAELRQQLLNTDDEKEMSTLAAALYAAMGVITGVVMASGDKAMGSGGSSS